MHITLSFVMADCNKKPNPHLLIIKLDTKGEKNPRIPTKVNTCTYEISATIVLNTDYFTLCNFQPLSVELRKETISSFMSVRPSSHTEQFGSHRTEFYEIWYFGIFPKSVEKVQVLLESDKNNGYFT